MSRDKSGDLIRSLLNGGVTKSRVSRTRFRRQRTLQKARFSDFKKYADSKFTTTTQKYKAFTTPSHLLNELTIASAEISSVNGRLKVVCKGWTSTSLKRFAHIIVLVIFRRKLNRKRLLNRKRIMHTKTQSRGVKVPPTLLEPYHRRSQNIIKALQALITDPEPTMWIFGYGSLIWNPGFRYKTAIRASVPDVSRKFYQGNFTHRGSKQLPGRVVTLVDEPGAECFGLLFKVTGLSAIVAALEHLYVREIEAGYIFETIRVQCLDSHPEESAMPPPQIDAITCIAPPENCHYLGPGDHSSVSWQIAHACGPAGPNCEYLLKLAAGMREHFPGQKDLHLFDLEKSVLEHLVHKKQQEVFNLNVSLHITPYELNM